LNDVYPIPHDDRICTHGFVAQGKIEHAPDVHALDIAKRLMDLGYAHPPTIYFLAPRTTSQHPGRSPGRGARRAPACSSMDPAGVVGTVGIVNDHRQRRWLGIMHLEGALLPSCDA
jgi:hypothetical protein